MEGLSLQSQDPDLFEVEVKPEQLFSGKYLPVDLLEKIESDLIEKLIHGAAPEDSDQTDSPLDFIQNIAENALEEFQGIIKDGNANNKFFLKSLTKIFSILLNIKADSREKIIKTVKSIGKTILKTWSEQN